jgi:acetate kinase
MNHTGPELITPELLDELHRITPYDPDHLPEEIEIIEAFRQRHPKLLQVACFDTAFHCTMPRVAKLLPIPRRFDTMGIRRYGFHGLSETSSDMHDLLENQRSDIRAAEAVELFCYQARKWIGAFAAVYFNRLRKNNCPRHSYRRGMDDSEYGKPNYESQF